MRMLLFLTGLLSALTLAAPSQAEAAKRPSILSRAQWGANENYGITSSENPEATQTARELVQEVQNVAALSDREKKCRDAVVNYPEDFQVSHTVTNNALGNIYRWAQRYSPEVKLLVIHHTGEVQTQERSNMTGKERVRAIYESHAQKNGWGDIGYHYLIDKEGVIYEGRAGGHGVVGAHAYCANVGTIGIALIGNFQNRYPQEEQLASLRWLLAELADEYGIDPTERVMFQGKSMPTIVAHRDLSATQCAGRRVHQFLPAIRRLVASRDFISSLLGSIPKIPDRQPTASIQDILEPAGNTTLRIPPRGVMNVQLHFIAGEKAISAGERIASVSSSNTAVGLWQKRHGSKIRVRSDIRAEKSLHPGERTTITLNILAPKNAGSYSLKIGDITYALEVSGRRMRNQ